METLDRLSGYINRVASDERLRPTHISLYFALCHSWIVNKFQRRYHVSRRQLMMSSRIRSRATYHKTMTELKVLGYVKYRPSYHPVEGSEVSLLGVSTSFAKDRAFYQVGLPFHQPLGNVRNDLNPDRYSPFTTSAEEVRDLEQVSPDLPQGDNYLSRSNP